MAAGRRDGHRAVVLGVGMMLVGALCLAAVVLLGHGPPGVVPVGVGQRAPLPHPDGPTAPVSRELRGPIGGGAEREVATGASAPSSDPEELPAVSVEVVGVSGALRPHLVVVFQRLGSPPHWRPVPCDAAGVATLRGDLPERMQLGLFQALVSDLRLQDAADGSFTWDVEPGARVQARPAEPIAGVRRATRPDGITPPLKLAFAPEQEIGPAREVQIARRAHLEAAEWLYLWSEDTRGFRMRPRDLVQATDDLWLADPARGEALARLRLMVPEDRVADAQRMQVLLRPRGGGESVHLHLDERDRWEGAAFRADRIPAGRWRAEWRSGARPWGVLAEEVVLRAGEETVLEGAPPVLMRWRGEVANWAEVPGPFRARHHLFVAGTLAEVDEEGRFEAELPAHLPPAELQVEFRGASSARLPGRVVTYDAQARTLVVEHPPVDDFGVVQVTVEPAFAKSGRSIVVLRGLDPRVPTLHLANPHFHGGYRAFVGVREDAVELPRWDPGPLTGALVETVRHDDQFCQQVTAWLSVPPGTERHTVRGAGRQVTLHLHRAVARALVYVQGPPDQPALLVTTLSASGSVPLWIARGTATVIVDLGNGEVQRLAPQGDALHVW